MEIEDIWDMDFEDEDSEKITNEEEEFAEEVGSFIQSLIDGEVLSDDIGEEFVSENALNNHFNWHCIGKHVDRVSKKGNIFYDFTNKDKYRLYEDKINNAILKSALSVVSLFDTDNVVKGFRKLFEGNIALQFGLSCGFRNDKGPVYVGFYAYSSNVTQNYNGGNTVDLCIISPKGKTVTLYPLDAHYVQTKFNSMIEKHSSFRGRFEFNKD